MPKENRKDLREIPRRVLKTLRVVLVDHMDEVLREAMVFPEPDTLFGPRRSLIEYRNGELIEEDAPAASAPRSVPPGDAPGEQPGSAERELPRPRAVIVAPRLLRRGGGLTPAGCRVEEYHT